MKKLGNTDVEEWGKFYLKRVIQIGGGVDLSTQIGCVIQKKLSKDLLGLFNGVFLG